MGAGKSIIDWRVDFLKSQHCRQFIIKFHHQTFKEEEKEEEEEDKLSGCSMGDTTRKVTIYTRKS
jgi:hypothetical protein